MAALASEGKSDANIVSLPVPNQLTNNIPNTMLDNIPITGQLQFLCHVIC